MPETVSRSLMLEIFIPGDKDSKPKFVQTNRIVASIRSYRQAIRHLFAGFALAQMAGADVEQSKTGPRPKPVTERAAKILGLAFGATVNRRVKPSFERALKSMSASLEKISKAKTVSEKKISELSSFLDEMRVASERHNWSEDVTDTGAAAAYEMRSYFMEHLLPTAKPFVFDCARRDALARWAAKDPDITNATRGWLILQAGRELALLNKMGIGFAAAVAPEALEEHWVTLDWDTTIGPVKFRITSPDKSRYSVLKRILAGRDGWSLGTIYLSEYEGTLELRVSYSKPILEAAVNPERVLEFAYQEDRACFLIGKVTEGNTSIQDQIKHRDLSALAALDVIDNYKKAMERLEGLRSACGTARRAAKGFGVPKAWHKYNRDSSGYEARRALTVRAWNHAWSACLVRQAVAWKCGTLRIMDLPKTLFERPWRWAEFKTFVEYKAKEQGIAVTCLDGVQATEVLSAAGA